MVNRINSSENLAIDAKNLESLRQSARENSPEALKTAAKQFEALFMNMIMKSMREATPQDGIFDNEQSRMYTSMLDTQLSQNLSKRGLGLADMLVRQLSANLGGQAEPASASYYKAASAQARQYAAWQPAELSSAAPADGVKPNGGQPAHVQAFQDRLRSHAEEASRTTGIPAKFMLGQAALETGWGRKEIVAADGTPSYNLFNIKAGGSWKGRVVEAVTTEYVDGVPQKRVEKFRAYDSYADAFRDYGRLLRSNPRYENVLANASDVSGFAQGLQRAGYATDPNYASKLTNIITQIL
ncbi:flagellar assembly peptidoglycan hydrolase FlgJ [Noviherbaspirillum sp. UKPF54]|uniref:flagellar assembly peptidoglycan hydrolase FlgJ n=1 Tax=Noviherbaspirillum sp. UKPF54 TaxID=2601898 RepID=UPI0011B11B10|nr:flagellar assembly peptidoglycan hydrolase FlgJ [Noviherbaspirillum sp. UKPF54]QDZ28121.1 flagellar assembly peptidoglycan hydrolase FlgJ [Noviherbaspirillum sp. UKPF54]